MLPIYYRINSKTSYYQPHLNTLKITQKKAHFKISSPNLFISDDQIGTGAGR